jgi:hypothetical protein
MGNIAERPHVVGSLTLNQHCTFTWHEFMLGERVMRDVDIEPHHCARCIQDVERLGLRTRDLRLELAAS